MEHLPAYTLMGPIDDIHLVHLVPRACDVGGWGGGIRSPRACDAGGIKSPNACDVGGAFQA